MWLATACLLLGRPRLYTPVPARVGQEKLLVQALANLSAAQARTVISEAESGIAGIVGKAELIRGSEEAWCGGCSLNGRAALVFP
jgi:hypothetical protein